MSLKNFALASSLSLALVACGAIPYKFYAPYPDSFKGVMVGAKEQRSFEECDPQGGDNKCVVLFVEEWAKVLRDKAELEERLKDLEKRCRQP